MNPIRKILAPVDLSRSVREDIRYAQCAAGTLGAELHLLYVGGSPESQANAAYLERAGLRVHRDISADGVAPAIVRHADSLDATLVLMNGRRFGPWRRLWRRSVTQEVMRRISKPVCITSRALSDGEFRLSHNRILCVVGLDGRETGLTRHAQEIAARSNAELILLHIVPSPSEALLYHAIDSGSRPLSQHRAQAELAVMAWRMRLQATMPVMVGDPAKCIAQAAHKYSADLALIARGRAGLPAAYGTGIEEIASRLRCPLVTIPTEHAPVPVRVEVRVQR